MRFPSPKSITLVALAALAVSAGLSPAVAAPKKGVGRGRDKTAPVLNVPADITTPATSPVGASVTFSVTAFDDGDPSPTVTCSPASGSTFRVGTTTVTATAKDWRGNTSTETFDVTVQPPSGSFHYRAEWYGWEAGVWYEWDITVSETGVVSGTGTQTWLLADPGNLHDYPLPMPAGLVGSGTLSGTIAQNGAGTIAESYSAWMWYEFDVDGNGDPIYTDLSHSFSGPVTVHVLNAAGDLSFSGGYNSVWMRQ